MSSASLSILRAPIEILPRHIIPPERRDVLEAPCEVCGRIKWVPFTTGVCTDCRQVVCLAPIERRA